MAGTGSRNRRRSIWSTSRCPRRFDKALRDFLDDRQAVRAGRKTAAKAKDFPKFKSKRDRDVSIYLPGSALKLIRRQAAAPDKARGWVELPGMDETQVWTRVKRNGRIEDKRVKLRRGIRVRGGRWPEGMIRSATITREGGAWLLSVQFDGPPPKKVERPSPPAPADKPVHPDPTTDNGPAADPDAGPETAAVGYDAGLKHLLVGSDGTHVPVGRNLRKAKKKLKREQRAGSRRTRRRVERDRAAPAADRPIRPAYGQEQRLRMVLVRNQVQKALKGQVVMRHGLKI